MKNTELESKMNSALMYASRRLNEYTNNPKPVLFHSFKVAEILYKYNYEENIILSGILHDLIEDTNTTKEDLEKEFNKEIANIVESVSFNPNIEDKLLQAKDMFNKAINYGKSSLIVKCADLIDNIDYVYLSKNSEELLKKYRLFLDMAKEYIGDEEIYKQLQDKVLNISK